MPLPPLVGHREARGRLAEGRRSGTLPQVVLITGIPGVGKQRLALWLAQLTLCETPGAEPCGVCRACHMVEGLAHPDLHWFVPIARPKAGEPGKQVEEAAEAIAATMAERRKQPFYAPPDGMAIHPIASVRLLQREAGLTAVEGGWKVFIIGDADRLVPQESSQEAANAMLKLLEEPPPRSLFVLTTVDPRQVLPTIRSRTAPVRLNRLADDEVREFLGRHAAERVRPGDLETRVQAAGGAIGLAVEGDAEESDKARRAASQLLEAVMRGDGTMLEGALRQAPYSARGDFTAMLDALAETLGDGVRATLGHATTRPVPERLRHHRDPASLLRALELVGEAREAAWGNVNPQLLLAVLGGDLAEVL